MLTNPKIRLSIMNSSLPTQLKLFLFGMNGKDFSRRANRKIQLLVQMESDSGRQKMNEDEIAGKISEWLKTGRNLASDFSMDDLSDELEIPKSVIRRYFEICVKTDFRIWKSDMRIEKAKELLLTEDISINEAAKAVGFKDKSNFHRRFKTSTGKTPGEWKESGGR